ELERGVRISNIGRGEFAPDGMEKGWSDDPAGYGGENRWKEQKNQRDADEAVFEGHGRSQSLERTIAEEGIWKETCAGGQGFRDLGLVNIMLGHLTFSVSADSKGVMEASPLTTDFRRLRGKRFGELRPISAKTRNFSASADSKGVTRAAF